MLGIIFWFYEWIWLIVLVERMTECREGHLHGTFHVGHGNPFCMPERNNVYCGWDTATCILHNNRFFKRFHIIYMSDAIYVDWIDTKKVTLLYYSTDVVLLVWFVFQHVIPHHFVTFGVYNCRLFHVCVCCRNNVMVPRRVKQYSFNIDWNVQKSFVCLSIN